MSTNLGIRPTVQFSKPNLEPLCISNPDPSTGFDHSCVQIENKQSVPGVQSGNTGCFNIISCIISLESKNPKNNGAVFRLWFSSPMVLKIRGRPGTYQLFEHRGRPRRLSATRGWEFGPLCAILNRLTSKLNFPKMVGTSGAPFH